jgi:F0F1-type ATP synthase membrane subunit b/b'
MSEAQILTAAREEKLQQYETALRAARTEGYHALEAEKTSALRERERRLGAEKEDLSRKVAAAIDTTRQQETSARRDLETQATELSRLIGTKVLRRPIR